MNYKHLFFGLTAVLAVSCTVEEIAPSGIIDSTAEAFYAYTEARSGDEDTKVFIDAENSHCIRWNKDDRITVFNRNTGVSEYAFTGEDGSSEGAFAKIQNGNGTAQGGTLPLVYAVYPHSGETSIQSDGTIHFNLPTTQNYLKDDSFGKDANVMVAQTDNNVLMFKNACGYLTLRFYGPSTGLSISSITLKGKNNEILSGPGTITMSDGIPTLSMVGGENTKEVRIFCKDVVELSKNDKNSCKEFWFVLPPVEFTKGFEITVATSNGGVYTKATSNPITIERNTVKRMALLRVTATADNTLKINSLTTKWGKEEIKDNSGNVTQIKDKTYTATPDDNLTCTFTMPTFTDFPHFVMEYSISDGAVMKVDDKVIVSGETSLDVTNPVSLAVCKGDKEKRYTLVVRNTGLPVVRISSPTSQAEIEDDEEHDTWYGGATLHIDKADGSVDLNHAPMSIKGRGNASWKYDKRPFAIKLDTKSKVLDMQSHKRWVLLANWKDRTLLRNAAAFWLSQQTDLPYSVHGKFVELEFNGVHRGNYYLCEQIKIGGKRVNITDMTEDSDPDTPWFHPDARKTGGFLMEIDNNYDETYKFLSGFYNGGLKYMFKEPEGPDPEKGITEEFFNKAKDYMIGYVTDMESEIKNISTTAYQNNDDEDYGYRYYLDMDSAIWFMFVNELTGNGDFFNTDGEMNTTYYGPHSTYLYKDRDVMNEDGVITTHNKLHFGPVWDFDYKTFVTTYTNYYKSGNTVRAGSTENRIKWVGAENQNYYYYYLCKDPRFRQQMNTLWSTYKEKVSALNFNQEIDRLVKEIRLSEEINTAMWGNTNFDQHQYQNGGDNLKTFDEAVALLKTAYSNKLTFMNNNLSTLNQ